MAKRIDKKTEEKLIRALEEASDEIEVNGKHPNDALIKVSKDYSLSPGLIQLLVQAYNNGRTNIQRKKSSDLFDKSASFPIADATVIINSIFPDKIVKKADYDYQEVVSEDYFRPNKEFISLLNREALFESIQTTTKTASQKVKTKVKKETINKDYAINQYINLVKKAEHVHSEILRDLNSSFTKLNEKYAQLKSYFKRLNSYSFSDVYKKSAAIWGNKVQMVLDPIATEIPKILEKKSYSNHKVDINKEPYSIIGDILTISEKCANDKIFLKSFSQIIWPEIIKIQSTIMPDRIKKASVLHGLVEKAANFHFGKYEYEIPSIIKLASKNKLIESENLNKKKQAMDLNDLSPIENKKEIFKLNTSDKSESAENSLFLAEPQLKSNLAKAKIKYMIYDLATTDPILSGYDIKEIVNAYNDIAKTAPRAALKPTLVRSFLRRYLAQGVLDIHDIEQLSKIETQLWMMDNSKKQPPAF